MEISGDDHGDKRTNQTQPPLIASLFVLPELFYFIKKKPSEA